MRRITEDEFLDFYSKAPDAPKLWTLLHSAPTSIDNLAQEFIPSKLWRLNNLYHITDQKAAVIPFNMNRSQFLVYSKILEHPRVIILKSRQQGISTLWLVSFFDDILFNTNLHCGVIAQNHEAAKTLLEKVKKMWERLPGFLKIALGLKEVVNNRSEFSLNNGSVIYIRTSFRSSTLVRLHISELAKQAVNDPLKAAETMSGTLQTILPDPCNLVVVESTAETSIDLFSLLWDKSIRNYKVQAQLAGKDFLPVFLSWTMDPNCEEEVDQIADKDDREYFTYLTKNGITLTQLQKNFWIAQHRELGDRVHQEYPAIQEEAFQVSKDGTYWSRLYHKYILGQGRKLNALYDENLPVYAVQDLGRGDYYVIIFFQFHDKMIRIIKEYFNTGEDIRHYADKILHYTKEHEWNLSHVIFPHDGNTIDLTANNKSRVEIFRECGVTNSIVLGKTAMDSSIQSVRGAMNNMWIQEDCAYIESCFLKFTKTWDRSLNVWRDDPARNEYKHGADAIRYMVQYTQSHMNMNFQHPVINRIAI